MDPQRLLEQFLGAGTAGKVSDAARQAKSGLASSGAGGLVGGLAAGGLLGLLMGNKKVRKKVGKLAGGAVGYGGAAALGALGYRAYQQWQSGQQAAPVDTAPPPDALPQEAAKFMPGAAPASDGRPFELVLVMAMIAAANADGHIGPEEQRNIFDQVGQLPLDAEDKAFIFDTLGSPPALADIAALAQGPEQATELYLASRLAIDVDHPAEQAYLDALAARLALPPELVAHLEAQAVGADRADSA